MNDKQNINVQFNGGTEEQRLMLVMLFYDFLEYSEIEATTIFGLAPTDNQLADVFRKFDSKMEDVRANTRIVLQG